MEEEFVEVKRPICNSSSNISNSSNSSNIISNSIIEDLGIIVKTLTTSKNNHNKNNDISYISKEELKKRNEGFYILANKMNISKHLKKTKFCNIFIQEGKCNRSVCNFAHSMEEYNFPSCAFGDKCKVYKCKFKHPFEKIDDYKKRVDFKLPKNIK